MLADVERAGPVAAVLAPFAEAPYEAAYVLRLLGGIHRLVLAGEAPALARHYPSTGGDGDAAAAMAAASELLVDPPAVVLDALTRPPQTNEVGRSAALGSGLMVVVAKYALPLRLREVGASGGLNLNADAYWYAQDGQGWGDRSSAVRFVDLWEGGTPPFSAPCHVVDRRGCDADPIDVRTEDGALTLLSYVWPEPAERFVRARHAIELARRRPPVVDRADVRRWLADQLAGVPGTALAVFHSVVWQYLDSGTQDAMRRLLGDAGAAATTDTPLAWLRLEPSPETYVPARLHLTLWDGSDDSPPDHLLATTGFHGGPIKWLG